MRPFLIALLGTLALFAATAGATITPITPGGRPIDGVLDSTDMEPIPPHIQRSDPNHWREIYTFYGRADAMAQINLTCSFDAFLILIGPGDVEIASNDDYQGINTSRIIATLPSAGTFQVVVTSLSPGQGGTFTISVNELQDPPPESRDERISMGQTVQGELEQGDNARLSDQHRGGMDFLRDGYRFRADAGTSIVIEANWTGFDGYLFLENGDDQVLAQHDDWGSTAASRIEHTLAEGGDHRIIATTFSGGQSGRYTLTLRERTEEEPQNPPGFQPTFHGEGFGVPPDQMMTVHESVIAQPTQHRPPDQAPWYGEGGVQLVSTPGSVTVGQGETFVTSLGLRSITGTGIDGMRICLRYDPQRLRPLRVSDQKLRDQLVEGASLSGDLANGELIYEARTHPGLKVQSLDLISIEWEAMAPAPNTRIALAREGDRACAVWLDGRNLLDGENGEGVVITDVRIAPAMASDFVGTTVIDVNDPTQEAALSGVILRRGIRVGVSTPHQRIAVGDEFDVTLWLDNPRGAALEDLHLALAFDPAVFQALDLARAGRGDGAGNWVTGGVNLLDAPHHEVFPFDVHLANEVDNARGLIRYHMGFTQPTAPIGGTVATLRLRAIAPARSASLRFLGIGEGGAIATRITCHGESVLGDPESGDKGTEDLTLRVQPRP